MDVIAVAQSEAEAKGHFAHIGRRLLAHLEVIETTQLKALALKLVFQEVSQEDLWKRCSLKVISGPPLASQKEWRARYRRPSGLLDH
jgi:hypothetical protein